MLRSKFTNAVVWCLSPDKQMETWQRVFQQMFNVSSTFTVEERKRAKKRLVHDQAARAIEWKWDQSPEAIYQFIKEDNHSGNIFGATPEEIFRYSQEHFRELLPKRVAPMYQEKLEVLRGSQDPSAGPERSL